MITSKRAFTLVEIMIMIVMIALLAAIAIPAVQRVRENGVELRIKNGIATNADWKYHNDMVRSGKRHVEPMTITSEEAQGRGSIVSVDDARYLIVKRDGKEIAILISDSK